MACGRQAHRLFLCCAALAFAVAVAAMEPAVEKSAPDFQATTIDGRTITLADFKGQVLVLNFWAARCAQCMKQLPLLESYYRLQRKFGLSVLAVAGGDSVSAGQLRTVAAALTISMARRFKGDYGPVQSVPVNYVIDRAGILRYAKAAALTLDDMNAILVPLLREHESPEIYGRPGEKTMYGG